MYFFVKIHTYKTFSNSQHYLTQCNQLLLYFIVGITLSAQNSVVPYIFFKLYERNISHNVHRL